MRCTDDSITLDCSAGGLVEGDNPLAAVHNQPLKSFEFNSDYSRFEMEGPDGLGVEVPSESDSRTWLMLEGELVDMVRVVTPECLCD